MTRLELIRQRLDAATPSYYRRNQWPWVDRDADWEFIDHAPQDIRDLIETLDRIIELTKGFHDRYEKGEDPDPNRPSHMILRNIHRIAMNLESEEFLRTTPPPWMEGPSSG